MAEVDDIRLESSTDTPAQVKAALRGNAPAPEAPEQPEAAATEEAPQEPPDSAAGTEQAEAPKEEAPPETPNEGADDEEDETDDDDEEDEPKAKEQPKPRRNAQRRINQLVKQSRQAERENVELRARLDALERQAQRPQQPPEAPAETAPQRDPDARPVMADYEDYDEFVNAVAEWTADKRVREVLEARDKQAREERIKAEQVEQNTAWETRLRDAVERYEDWDEVTSTLTIPRTPALEEAIITSEVGPDILYYLGQNIDEARKLAEMSPVALAREIGRIESRLQSPSQRSPEPPQEAAPPPPAAPEPPRARPAPPTPVTPGTSSVARNPDEMDYDDFRSWRKQGGGR